ncbi:MAG: FAD-binding oxidoreductase [Planctomycetota bacterium]
MREQSARAQGPSSTPLWRSTRGASERRVDLLIVGAGITGVAAARAASRRGVCAVVVSNEAAYSAASRRNAGYLMRGAAENYARAARAWGRDRARTLWRWSEENLNRLRELGVERVASYRRTPSCLLALDTVEADELEVSIEMMREDGFAVERLTPGVVRDAAWARLDPRLGLVNPDDASVNPEDAIALLRAEADAVFLDGCSVQRLERDGSRVIAHGSHDRIVADRVLLATNSYAGVLLDELEPLVQANRGQMLAVRAPDLRLDASYYANFGGEYFRATHDGHLVIGGFRKSDAPAERTQSDAVSDVVQSRLQSLAERLLAAPPGALGAAARWAGSMGFSVDGMPLIGPVGADRLVWFCGGYTGHGMSLGVRCAEAAIDAMLDGGETPFPLSRAVDAPSL